MPITKSLDQIERRDSPNRRQTEPEPLRISHILAPTDLSRESRKAVKYALWLAQRFHAKLTLLHFYETPGTFECAFGVPEPERLQQDKDRAELRLLALHDVVRAQHGNTEPLFRCGEPRTGIPAAAKMLGVDLIVISTHDYQWSRHVIEGSDAETIIHKAPCPVLIVHEN
ncbi:MAG: universal stress protein [Verrucomicrobia bacterium]|jgi:universal stress protein A|nr:universal stress protein [Verrucomicrobiota bacterium]